MRLVVALNFILLLAGLMVYQNCSPQHTDQVAQASSLNIFSMFPYGEDDLYYDDVQIVEKVQVGNEWSYKLIASIVNVEEEDELVEVDFMIYDINGDLVCPRLSGSVNRSTNHLQLPDCRSTLNLDHLKVEVHAGAPGAMKQLLRTHILNL